MAQPPVLSAAEFFAANINKRILCLRCTIITHATVAMPVHDVCMAAAEDQRYPTSTDSPPMRSGRGGVPVFGGPAKPVGWGVQSGVSRTFFAGWGTQTQGVSNSNGKFARIATRGEWRTTFSRAKVHPHPHANTESLHSQIIARTVGPN